MGTSIHVTKMEFADYVALYGLENAINHYFSLASTIEFDDGSVYTTKEDLSNFYAERQELVKDRINRIDPNKFK